MSMSLRIALLASILFCSACRHAAPADTAKTVPEPDASDRVARSDENSRVLVEALARFIPESFSELGFPGLDDAVYDLRPAASERLRAALRAAVDKLRTRRGSERDAFVAQDLDILLGAAEQMLRQSELDDRYFLPYPKVHLRIFRGLSPLRSAEAPAEAKAAALRRLRRYAGLEPDFEPLATLATARIRERLDAPALLFPLRREVEKDLEDAAPLRKGIEQMIAPAGSEQDRAALEALLRQLEEYEAFVRAGVLPRAREDQRLPRDLYAHLLVSNGIEASPEELLELGREGLRETEAALQQAAGSITARRNFPGSRWQDVLREIKRETIEPAQMTDHYTSRIAQLEEIVRKHDLVTMPSRGVRIRTTSDAESVADPVPHVDPAGLIAGGGELSFVIPLVADGRADEDFSFEAISWTVTAHEGRPGHELQMTAMKERGLSLARRLFALNAANVEGWAVYSEMLVAPFIPEEARFVGLHNLALRQARAYLDPALNLGQIQPDEALALLTSFGFSRSFAEKELDRYLFDTPGRDGAYYYGLLRMKELRAAAEKQLGPRFNLRRFHDAVLAQGALPFSLLTPAVLEDLSAEASPKRGPGL